MRSIEQIARRHNGLELLVAQRLQQLMAFLGVRIHLVRLICQPEETMLNARIAGEARAQELVALAGAFGQEVQIEALMRLEMLEAWRQSNRQPFAAFELPNPFGNGKDDSSNRMHFVIGPH
jgi:hypothetical protein